MLDRADRLYAVWDGKPARGYGGTADVVTKHKDAESPSRSSGPTAHAEVRQRERCNLDTVTEALPTDWWNTRDVATFLNVAPFTIRAYAARGQMPEADRRIGREPVWRPETIQRWHDQRPRQPRG